MYHSLPHRFFTSSTIRRAPSLPPKSSPPNTTEGSSQASEAVAATARTTRKRQPKQNSLETSGSTLAQPPGIASVAAGAKRDAQVDQASEASYEDGMSRETIAAIRSQSGSQAAKAGDPPSDDGIHAATTTSTIYPSQPPFSSPFQSRDGIGGGGSGPGESFPTAARKSGAQHQSLEWIGNIQNPRTIVKHLDEYVIGQDKAKKILAVAVYNHYSRVSENLRQQQIQESLSSISSAPPSSSSSVLMNDGPSTPDPIIEPYSPPSPSAVTPSSPGPDTSPSSKDSGPNNSSDMYITGRKETPVKVLPAWELGHVLNFIVAWTL
ncbi:hypothetical protein BGX34_005876 [Mortierella sp. NVP85]|nr:hypothetical protein BGX34_005876 [Mortierella sp. NVP85]